MESRSHRASFLSMSISISLSRLLRYKNGADSVDCGLSRPRGSQTPRTAAGARRLRSSRGVEGVIIMPDWPTASFSHFFKGEPFILVQKLRPYVFQNEDARGTPLFGNVNFDFNLFYFKT